MSLSPWTSSIDYDDTPPAATCQDPQCEQLVDVGLFTLPSGQLLCGRCCLMYLAWLLDPEHHGKPDAYEWVTEGGEG